MATCPLLEEFRSDPAINAVCPGGLKLARMSHTLPEARPAIEPRYRIVSSAGDGRLFCTDTPRSRCGENDVPLSQAMGLHAGWAIEGVAGSMFKVDATFLSAAVELPVRVVEASRPLDVPIVLTGDFCVRARVTQPHVPVPCRRPLRFYRLHLEQPPIAPSGAPG